MIYRGNLTYTNRRFLWPQRPPLSRHTKSLCDRSRLRRSGKAEKLPLVTDVKWLELKSLKEMKYVI